MDSRAATPKVSGFRSFAEFYPFYIREHRHPVSRLLHYIGTWGAILCFTALIVLGEPLWLLGSIVEEDLGADHHANVSVRS